MQSDDARILRGSALIAAPLGIAATVVSAIVAGGKGLIGGLVALAVVAVFFGLGSWALMRLTQDRPQIAMTAGLLVYTVQILLIGIFIVVFKGTSLFNGRAFALSLLVTALAWVGGQVRHSLTSKMLYVRPEPSVPAKGVEGGARTAKAAAGDGPVGAGSRDEA
jgi:ATP synthase protein I